MVAPAPVQEAMFSSDAALCRQRWRSENKTHRFATRRDLQGRCPLPPDEWPTVAGGGP